MIVDQPPNTPSTVRTIGNSLTASSSLRLATQSAIGSWLVYLTTHLNFRPLGSSTFSEVNYQTAYYSVPNGTSVDTTYSVNFPNNLEPRGDSEYRVTLTTHGTCGGTDYNLTPTMSLRPQTSASAGPL